MVTKSGPGTELGYVFSQSNLEVALLQGQEENQWVGAGVS